MKNYQHTYRPCSSYSETTIASLLERSPGDPEIARWTAHADICPNCREILTADRQLVADLKRLPDPAPVWVRATVMSRISVRQRPRLFRVGDLAWGASAAFAGVILGMVLVWNSSSNIQVNGVTNTGDELASLTVVDGFDTFIADLADNQGE